jgi:uncharacterized protein (DUF1800 family)
MGKKERTGPASTSTLQVDEVFTQYANRELPLGVARTNSTLDPYTGPWTRKEVIHLLRRTTFGLRNSDIQNLLALSPEAAVNQLIDSIPAAPPDPPLNNYNAVANDTTGVLPGQTWVNADYGDGNINAQRMFSFKSWWMSLLLEEPMNMREKMVLFWHNHFATESQIISTARNIYNHNALLRQFALGNFKSLVKAITIDPGMLRYLNGDKNTASSPDENYGRELQELFTLGVGNNPNYTQADVTAAAKVLSGWRTNAFSSYFDPKQHSTADKQFSAFYNNTLIQYKPGSDGALETDALIDMIFSKVEAAKHICRKLYRFFVYYIIDDTIENTIISPLAQTLISGGFEIKPVMKQLLKSAHFFDPLNQGCYIKSPIDFLTGTFKTFGLQVPVASSVDVRYKAFNYVRNYGLILAQDLGDPPNVAGWPAFHQNPQYYQVWINSNTLPKRLIFTDSLLSNGINMGGTTIKIDAIAFAKQCPKPDDPDILLDFFIELLLAVPISTAKRGTLKSILLSNQVTNSYWTVAWGDYVLTPTTVNENIVRSRLNPLLLELTRMAEHQLA